MYDLVPTNELAIESISCPLTPKSQSLISPLELTNILDGFTSREKKSNNRNLSNVFALPCELQLTKVVLQYKVFISNCETFHT